MTATTKKPFSGQRRGSLMTSVIQNTPFQRELLSVEKIGGRNVKIGTGNIMPHRIPEEILLRLSTLTIPTALKKPTSTQAFHDTVDQDPLDTTITTYCLRTTSHRLGNTTDIFTIHPNLIHPNLTPPHITSHRINPDSHTRRPIIGRRSQTNGYIHNTSPEKTSGRVSRIIHREKSIAPATAIPRVVPAFMMDIVIDLKLSAKNITTEIVKERHREEAMIIGKAVIDTIVTRQGITMKNSIPDLRSGEGLTTATSINANRIGVTKVDLLYRENVTQNHREDNQINVEGVETRNLIFGRDSDLQGDLKVAVIIDTKVLGATVNLASSTLSRPEIPPCK